MTAFKQFELGKRHMLDGSYKLALQHFDKAIKKQSDVADFHSERGVALFHLNRKEDALAALNKALMLEPDNPYRYSSRAFIKDSMGDTEGAIQDYLQCIKIDPEDAIAFNNLGMLEEKMGRKTSAKKRFKRADELISLMDPESGQIKFAPDETEKPRNIQKEINEEKKQDIEKGITGIMLDVFRNKNTRKEFLEFVKSGMKGKKNDIS